MSMLIVHLFRSLVWVNASVVSFQNNRNETRKKKEWKYNLKTVYMWWQSLENIHTWNKQHKKKMRKKLDPNGKLCSDRPPNHCGTHRSKDDVRQQREPKLSYRTRSSTAWTRKLLYTVKLKKKITQKTTTILHYLISVHTYKRADTQVRNTTAHTHKHTPRETQTHINHIYPSSIRNNVSLLCTIYVHKSRVYTLNCGLCVLEKRYRTTAMYVAEPSTSFIGASMETLYFFRVTHINSLIRLFVHHAHTSVVFYLSVGKDPDFEKSSLPTPSKNEL